jgi:hypothetical protein
MKKVMGCRILKINREIVFIKNGKKRKKNLSFMHKYE